MTTVLCPECKKVALNISEDMAHCSMCKNYFSTQTVDKNNQPVESRWEGMPTVVALVIFITVLITGALGASMIWAVFEKKYPICHYAIFCTRHMPACCI